MMAAQTRPLVLALALLVPLAACNDGGARDSTREVARQARASTGSGAGSGSALPGTASSGTAGSGTAGQGTSNEGGVAGQTGDRQRPRGLDGLDLGSLSPGARVDRPAGGPTVQPTVSSKLLVDGEDTAKFGRIIEGDSGEHIFELRIDGDEPITIFDHQSTCGCTLGEFAIVKQSGESQPYVEGTEIAPDSVLRITGRLITDNKRGESRHTITLRHNGSNRATMLNFESDVVPIFEYEPGPYLNFKEMFVNETRSTTVTVFSKVLDAFTLTVDPSFGLPEYFHVVTRAIEPDADGRSNRWEIEGTIGPRAPESLGGQQGLTVMLASDVELPGASPLPDGRPRMRIVTLHAVARVKPLVHSQPAFLSFGAVRPGSSAERPFNIEIGDEFVPDPKQLQKITVLASVPDDQAFYDQIFKARLVDLGNRHYQVFVSFDAWPEGRLGPFRGEVRVEIGHPDKGLLIVPFSGVAAAPRNGAG